MRQIHFRIVTLVALLGVSSVLFSLNRATTWAVEGGRYELGWYVVGFGGGESAGGNYAVSSTVGQANADELAGGVYTLGSGFWGGGQRVVAPVTPTATVTVTATPTATPTAGTSGATATPTATATQVGEPSPTATTTPTRGSVPTATPTPLGNTNEAARLYLPLLQR